MPEVRQDPLLGFRVIFAPERATRPFDHSEMETWQPLAPCPFCRGNESETAAAVLELSACNATGACDWGVRVVPNRYPAVTSNASSSGFQSAAQDCRLLMERLPIAALGVHEVIIEAPHHVTSISSLGTSQFRLITRSYRERLRAIRDSGKAIHATVFKNEGVGAGASLEHVHSQLIATTFVADAVAQEISQARQFFAAQACCFFCDLMQHERQARERLVLETEDFVCWCPFASRYASEIWVAPRRHRACFEDTADAELDAFAGALRGCLMMLERTLPGVAFNFVIHSAEFAAATVPYFHWHLEIKPRVMGLAGFEVGAGCHINVTLPEVAAVALRNVSD